MNKLVIFTKNFSPEYKRYILKLIPMKWKVEINSLDSALFYQFDRDTFGFIYGTKQDEDLEKIRVNFTFKNEPYQFDIDELYPFLKKITL